VKRLLCLLVSIVPICAYASSPLWEGGLWVVDIAMEDSSYYGGVRIYSVPSVVVPNCNQINIEWVETLAKGSKAKDRVVASTLIPEHQLCLKGGQVQISQELPNLPILIKTATQSYLIKVREPGHYDILGTGK
jgi:hypothetical protein